jgi:hypothetical protein
MDLKPLHVERQRRNVRTQIPDMGNLGRPFEVVEWKRFFRDVVKGVGFDCIPEFVSVEKV